MPGLAKVVWQGEKLWYFSDQCGGPLYCGTALRGRPATPAQWLWARICAAGEVSACRVCKSDGLGWADDVKMRYRSKCSLDSAFRSFGCRLHRQTCSSADIMRRVE